MSISEMLKELAKLVNPHHAEYDDEKATVLARAIWAKYDKEGLA